MTIFLKMPPHQGIPVHLVNDHFEAWVGTKPLRALTYWQLQEHLDRELEKDMSGSYKPVEKTVRRCACSPRCPEVVVGTARKLYFNHAHQERAAKRRRKLNARTPVVLDVGDAARAVNQEG